ncbi:hypothetical protein CEXT_14781 [Caerostris extrusa]|uniref:Uncharacterized protein n=1 Tax=Caerostris extrusa TaxID=172846 RepID=A0AAV4XQ58_CAEEX|nr:hypothetical protein CEXT_14781 [Caerostris extrusa]
MLPPCGKDYLLQVAAEYLLFAKRDEGGMVSLRSRLFLMGRGVGASSHSRNSGALMAVDGIVCSTLGSRQSLLPSSAHLPRRRWVGRLRFLEVVSIVMPFPAPLLHPTRGNDRQKEKNCLIGRFDASAFMDM